MVLQLPLYVVDDARFPLRAGIGPFSTPKLSHRCQHGSHIRSVGTMSIIQTTSTTFMRHSYIRPSEDEDSKRHYGTQDETSIARAYRVASIARARMQQEAERIDHDLRLLVSHANLLDRLAERIEEVEPDFTLGSLDHIIIEPLGQRTKPVRSARIEDILRRIDLSECTDEDDLYDEVYDESEDDLDEPLTSEKADLEVDPPLLTERVEKPTKRSQDDTLGLSMASWKGYSLRLPFYRRVTPIITAAEL